MDNDGLIYRKYQIGDENKISEFRKSFPPLERKKNRPSYYLWKYSRNPAGEPEVWLAEAEGKIVGLLAAVLKPFIYKGEKLLAAELGDAYVLREYQGRNVFKALGERIFSGLNEKKVGLIYGIPNNIALPIWKRKFKMKNPFSLVKMVRILRTRSLLGKKIKSRIVVTIVSFILDRIVRLFSCSSSKYNYERIETFERFSFLNNFGLCTDKNHEYLNWRYHESPCEYDKYIIKNGGQKIGYAVIARREEKGLKTGYIVDLIIESKSDVGSIINGLVRILDKEYMDLVIFWTTKNNLYYRTFRKKQFFALPDTVNFIIKTGHDESDDYQGFSSFLSIGDTDNI